VDVNGRHPNMSREAASRHYEENALSYLNVAHVRSDLYDSSHAFTSRKTPRDRVEHCEYIPEVYSAGINLEYHLIVPQGPASRC
jgi:hypothetical protein